MEARGLAGGLPGCTLRTSSPDPHRPTLWRAPGSALPGALMGLLPPACNPASTRACFASVSSGPLLLSPSNIAVL